MSEANDEQPTLAGSGLDQRAGSPADLLVSRVTVVDPAERLDGVFDLLIENGRIAKLAEPGGIDPGELGEIESIDGSGLHAFPAFVDPHVHLRTPGQEHKEDLETGTRAAAAGGYCAVVAMANTSPPVSDASDLLALRRLATERAFVGVGFMATLTRAMRGTELTEMLALREAGALGFTDDGLPVADAGLMQRALQYQRMTGGPIALHEEDPDLSRDGAMHEGETSAMLGLAGVPSVSESTMVARDLALASYEGGSIQLQHISAAESVEAIAAFRAEGSGTGANVAAEATPHHLCLTDEAVRSLDPSRHKMNPPLRAESDRQALIAALRDGDLTCIATDHAPHAPEDKQVPYEEAAMGVTGLEVAFASLHTHLVRPGVLPLEVLISRMTCGGEPFGVSAPRIAVGSEANLTICDLSREWVPGADGYESRSTNCWCDGEKLTGRPLVTVAGGQIAYRLRSFSLGVA